MPLIWNAAMFACDFQKGITIAPVRRFEDIGPEGSHPYCYSQGDLAFEFRASSGHDWRMSNSFTARELHSAFIAIYIIENTIQSGFRRAGREPLTSAEYQELKQNIGDGMLALCTQGGDYFRYVPDFRLEFVEFEREVPQQPPRPSTLDNVVVNGTSESPLSFGVYKDKDITFVYCYGSAHDPGKGTTITRIGKFEEIGFDDPMPYIYSQNDLEFEFRASTYREWRIQSGLAGETITRPHTATYVIEESIKLGLAAKSRFLAPDEYQRVIENIREGVWAIETRSGSQLNSVPDFRLEFVRSAKDAPKWAPRPSHWNYPNINP